MVVVTCVCREAQQCTVPSPSQSLIENPYKREERKMKRYEDRRIAQRAPRRYGNHNVTT
jgi:hypothetical protein